MTALLKHLFYFDPVSKMMSAMSLFTVLSVGTFASRYLKGDSQYRWFFFYLALLALSILTLVNADHLALFFISWCSSNFLLVRLMIHKSNWQAAKSSGVLASKNYLLGSLFLLAGFLSLFALTQETSIRMLIQKPLYHPTMMFGLLCLILAAMTQSAIWPFHKWLLSSLNSPTPVSAIMHAGLVNGGGFLLIKFAPLYLKHPPLMDLIFILGISTALIGTLWKLLQHDVKRLFACSTVGQMGFMLAQCGLGLFSAALAHLITHGLFKAYLFLSSGEAAQVKRYDLSSDQTVSLKDIFFALGCGILGGSCFSQITYGSWVSNDTSLILSFILFMSTTQIALSILQSKKKNAKIIAIFMATVLSLSYGLTMSLVKKGVTSMQLMQPQPLNFFHLFGIASLTLCWFIVLLFKNTNRLVHHPWLMKGYVMAYNASQPHPKTITAHRNEYQYL